MRDPRQARFLTVASLRWVLRHRAWTPGYLIRYWRFAMLRVRHRNVITTGFVFLGRRVRLEARQGYGGEEPYRDANSNGKKQRDATFKGIDESEEGDGQRDDAEDKARDESWAHGAIVTRGARVPRRPRGHSRRG